MYNYLSDKIPRKYAGPGRFQDLADTFVWRLLIWHAIRLCLHIVDAITAIRARQRIGTTLNLVEETVKKKVAQKSANWQGMILVTAKERRPSKNAQKLTKRYQICLS